MGRLTKAELTTAIDIFSHPQSGDESDIFAAYTTARVAMKELKQYKDLEEAGRLIELPCAVGDTVWCTDREDDGKGAVTHTIHSEPFACLVKDLWGIKFFATKEEAEAKLKELEELKG